MAAGRWNHCFQRAWMRARLSQPDDGIKGLRRFRSPFYRKILYWHVCAALLLENGATLKQVQEWLGHHSYVVTADTYGHVLAETKREMADTMSKLLGKEQAV